MTRKFERWKQTIDYAVRNITTGDEEETRLFEDPNSYIKGFIEEGIPEELMDTIRTILAKLVAHYTFNTPYPDWRIREAHLDAILAILKHYMSHQELYDKDYGEWEDAFWKAQRR